MWSPFRPTLYVTNELLKQHMISTTVSLLVPVSSHTCTVHSSYGYWWTVIFKQQKKHSIVLKAKLHNKV